MNNIYLLKQSLNQESLLENQIYDDLYEYKEEDNINLKMLICIILNNNIDLFNKVLTTKKLTIKETEILLEKIVEEGDSHLVYFLYLFEKITNSQKKWNNLIKKAMISNSFSILEILLKNNNKLNVNIIIKGFEKNPNLKLLKFCFNNFNRNIVLSNKILDIILNGDYLDLFKCFVSEKENLKWSQLLNRAIYNNSYQIIYYILEKIDKYKINEGENYYDNLFDFLVTEKFEKVILLLDKCHTIFNFGVNNLEKLLLSFNKRSEVECLLFKYFLSKIELNNKELKNTIDKYILENKLENKLKERKSSNLIKKI